MVLTVGHNSIVIAETHLIWQSTILDSHTLLVWTKTILVFVSTEPRWGKATFHQPIGQSLRWQMTEGRSGWHSEVHCQSPVLGIPHHFSSFSSDNSLALIGGRSSTVSTGFNINTGWHCSFVDEERFLALYSRPKKMRIITTALSYVLWG